MIPPNGGAIDTSPPQLISTFVEQEIKDSITQIICTFDEIILENNFKEHFFTSPPIINYEYRIKNNTLFLKINEILNKDLVYKLNFGSGLKDHLEGNVLDSLSIYLNQDTLKISKLDLCDIKFKVVNAFNQEDCEGHWVLLYEHNKVDFTNYPSPDFVARTDNKGEAAFHFLPNKDYYVVTLSGNNYMIDPEDKIGFREEVINFSRDSTILIKSFHPNFVDDSIICDLTDTLSELGALLLDVGNIENAVVKIINDNKLVSKHNYINGKINTVKLLPGLYDIQVFIDENHNFLWDTGSFNKRKQPEEIILYRKKIKIKSNWDTKLSTDAS
ncbi:MAG: hypothetical protein CMP51_02040 [Flavobacteriales bacterium]|nr:hypothetical protein [Flavobacteriales bacterium]|tara:strand:- start:327 stop:1313 length:987 start_codon:yes stop_codon:yes gene_type:complete